jgi:hypothetical protein
MAKSIPNLQAADAAVSFALQGNMPLFMAVMREGEVNLRDIEFYTTLREYDPHISASLVFEVAVRGGAPMLKHLLFTRGITPHVGVVLTHTRQRLNDEIKHLKTLRTALSTEMFNDPNLMTRFGREEQLAMEKAGWKRTLIPEEALSEALPMVLAQRGIHVPMTEICLQLLKRAEAQMPKPEYVPPALVSAEDYRASYESHVAKRIATRGRNLMQLNSGEAL